MMQLNAFAQEVIVLDNWQFRQSGTNKWYQAKIPGTVHTDLQNGGLIPDPFYRDNETSLQWIDKVDWEYKTTFPVDNKLKEADAIELVFEGLDTYADVFLNGNKIESSQNMFVPESIYIDPSSLKEKNELAVRFRSPVMEGLKNMEAYGLPLPADNDQSETGGMGPNKVSVFTRKAPYHFGWDWGPRLVTSGIWRPAYLKPIKVAQIKDLAVIQENIGKAKASLIIEVSMDMFTTDEVTVNIAINDKTVKSLPFKANGKSGTLNIPIEIDNPQLWWPNGHGAQYLYKIKATIDFKGNPVDSSEQKTGLRSVELVRKPDSDGETFYFRINGKPIFAKGANYIPSDVFLPRTSPEKYEYIVSSAAQANINMLRVWGGGIYEDDLFYDLCDKYGIMIWQDFMFACAMYPGDKVFLTRVTNEAEANIKRLRNHPCITLWCGNNEIEQAWGQYEEKRGWGWKERYTADERKIIWKAYDTIFHAILPQTVKELNSAIPYWHSSPSAGMGKLASHTNTSGDIHYWGVWHGKEPIADYTKYKGRFMSEYGFQSFPEFETVKQFTEQEDWNIDSHVMKSHQRSGIGNQRVLEYMTQSYKIPSAFDELLYISQLLQAEAINKAIRYHRSEMPYCMGSLYWQLNDCWPAASWSGMDYTGRWKALHYTVRDAFKNQILFINVVNNSIVIKGISDNQGTKATVNVNLMDFYGKSLWNKPYSVTLPSNSAAVLASIDMDKLPAQQNKDVAFLYVTLTVNGKIVDSQNYFFSEPKDLKLPYPDVYIHIREKPGRYELEISSKNLCKNLMLISEGNAYSFSDNFFDILPGQTKIVTVDSKLSYSEFFKKLSYIHLQQTEQ